nr:MAG TPA: hypothetical protein [Caudoviricetes sp.]
MAAAAASNAAAILPRPIQRRCAAVSSRGTETLTRRVSVVARMMVSVAWMVRVRQCVRSMRMVSAARSMVTVSDVRRVSRMTRVSARYSVRTVSVGRYTVRVHAHAQTHAHTHNRICFGCIIISA